MAYGRVRHSSSKVARAYYKNLGRSKRLAASVVVNRMGYAASAGKYRGYFEARACLNVRKAGNARCGALVWGKTPTAAVKKALSALAKSLK